MTHNYQTATSPAATSPAATSPAATSPAATSPAATSPAAIRDLSIYIPTVFAHVTEDFIKKKFDYLGIGSVSHVVFAQHAVKSHNRMAFVYLNNWYEANWSEWLNEYLLAENSGYKIIYDDECGKFWYLLPNKSTYVETDEFDVNPKIDERLCRVEQILFPLNGELPEFSVISKLTAAVDSLNSRLSELEIPKPTLKRQVMQDYTHNSSYHDGHQEYKSPESPELKSDISDDVVLIDSRYVGNEPTVHDTCDHLTLATDKYNETTEFDTTTPMSSRPLDKMTDSFNKMLYDDINNACKLTYENLWSNSFSSILLVVLFNMSEDHLIDNAVRKITDVVNYAAMYGDNNDVLNMQDMIRMQYEYNTIRRGIINTIEQKMKCCEELLVFQSRT
jgi:hypothetical protein